MTTLESKTDSAAVTGKNLHAWLLKMILACSKKYTMTYYCRFQCGNCVIMPTGHECSCCCEVERVSEDHVSPGRVVLGPNVPLSGHDVPPPPTTTTKYKCRFSSDRKLGVGLRTRLAAFSKALLRTLMQRISLVPRPHPKFGERAWSHLQKFLYVLCQQSSFGVEESRSSIAN